MRSNISVFAVIMHLRILISRKIRNGPQAHCVDVFIGQLRLIGKEPLCGDLLDSEVESKQILVIMVHDGAGLSILS
jgi:hypothetical protein